MYKRLFLAILCTLPTACALGPDYVRPAIKLPVAFKELDGFKPAQPKDQLPPGNWWQLFGDPQLNALEAQVDIGNQALAEAEAQYRQAQHLAQAANSAFFPSVTATGAINRFRAASGQNVAVSGVRNLFSTALSIAWEPDLWGSLRRQLEAGVNTAQASAATLQALRLSLQATLAQDYFLLRTLDSQQRLLDKTVAAYRQTLVITQHRYAAGIAARSDLALAETQLESVRAQAINIGVQRAQLEHAVAVLLGKTPAELNLAPAELTLTPPSIPAGLPSQLLERRPDIAAAERQAAAANAQIGVAKAAYFPSLTLGATNGFQSTTAANLFTLAHRYWSLGPAAAALTLLDGGARGAQMRQALAAFDASAAYYRQTVLTGLQEVEDNLAALRILARQTEAQQNATQSARAALTLTERRYRAGTTGYLEVLAAQTAALSNETAAVELLGQRLGYSVLLIKALGGGWTGAELPSAEQAVGGGWRDRLPIPPSRE